MKDDKLEKFIIENRNEFDAYEPGPDVWDRINPNAEKPKVKLPIGIGINLTKILWQAAAIAVIFVSSFFFVQMLNEGNVEIKISETFPFDEDEKDVIIPELAEAEAYYTSQVNKKMTEVRKFSASYPDLESEVMYDLTELDSICTELKEDLKDNIDNEEIVNAMIHNYRLKLEILEDILMYLNDSEETDTTNESPRYEI